jgi:hypothetical protein
LKREIDAFRDGLRTLGQIEGRDLRFEYRFADGHLDRLSARSPAEAASDLAASRQGLGQAGYFEGKAGRQGGLFLFAEQPGVSGNGLAARRK